jgi:hypothetical protein
MQKVVRKHAVCENHTDLTYSLFDCNCHCWLIADQIEPEPGCTGITVTFQRTAVPLDLKEKVMVDAVFGQDDQTNCDVHLVLEPFKVRTITASSIPFGWLGRFWQKRIHRKVGKHPLFEYTHAPCSLESIQLAFDRIPCDHLIVSGDYEAATDNIEMVLTLAAWRECCDYLYPDRANRTAAFEIGSEMLSGQTLHYRKMLIKLIKEQKGGKSLVNSNLEELEQLLERLNAELGIVQTQEQTQGQLMGCILSFFLLCMINATTVRMAFERCGMFSPDSGEEQHRECRLEDLPCKINGDDVLFHATEVVVETWKEIALKCGLKPSLGKNFVSKEFGMINSEMYRFAKQERWTAQAAMHVGLSRYQPFKVNMVARPGAGYTELLDIDEHLSPVSFIPYLNLGLLTGQGRVQEDTRVDRKFLYGDDVTMSCGARAWALIRGFSATKSRALMERFIEINRETLETTRRGWGIPEELGGLGLPYVDNHSVESLVVAAYLDKADPVTYKREMSMIKGVVLDPPPFVADAVQLQNLVMEKVAKKRWGTIEEAKMKELPLLVGATWVDCDLEKAVAHRTVNPERAYRHLVNTAVNSGVKKMTRERLDNLRGKVVVHDFDAKVASQMEAWIPRVYAQILNVKPLVVAESSWESHLVTVRSRCCRRSHPKKVRD